MVLSPQTSPSRTINLPSPTLNKPLVAPTAAAASLVAAAAGSPTILPDVQSLCLTQSPENSNDKQTLHTINEESLKKLLYGDDD